MARALEFDYDKAIDKATRIFWKKGYSGTSLRDLLKGMGIGEGFFLQHLKKQKTALRLNALSTTTYTVGRRRFYGAVLPGFRQVKEFAVSSERC